MYSDRRRANRHELKHDKFVLERQKILFPREAVGPLFLELFEARMDMSLTEQLRLIILALSRRVGDTSRGPFQSKIFYNSSVFVSLHFHWQAFLKNLKDTNQPENSTGCSIKKFFMAK